MHSAIVCGGACYAHGCDPAGRAGGAPLLRVPHPRGPGHQPRPRRRVRQVVHHRGPREVRDLIKFIELVQDIVTNIHHPNYFT